MSTLECADAMSPVLKQRTSHQGHSQLVQNLVPQIITMELSCLVWPLGAAPTGTAPGELWVTAILTPAESGQKA